MEYPYLDPEAMNSSTSGLINISAHKPINPLTVQPFNLITIFVNSDKQKNG